MAGMIYTEMTPNPAAIKFVVSETEFYTGGTLDYKSAGECEGAPVAAHLFKFEYVRGIMIGRNFITVTRDPAWSWEEIIPKVKDQIRNFLDSGEKPVTVHPESETTTAAEDNDVVRMIKKLLDENIRPAVAMDGGDVIFDSFEDGIVKLKMNGACTGCPSSTATLKIGIEGLLTRMIPEVKAVEAT